MASLQRNVASQHIKFVLVNATTGAADATGTGLAGKVTIDGGAQASVAGSFTNLGNGQYDYTPSQGETNCTDVGFLFTATGDIPVGIDFHIDPINFTSLSVDANGNVSVTSNIKKNTASNGNMIVMRDSTTNQPKTGLGSFQPQRSIDGAALVNTTNTVSELGSGIYTHNWSAADTNGNHVIFVYAVSGANTSFLEIWTQP